MPVALDRRCPVLVFALLALAGCPAEEEVEETPPDPEVITGIDNLPGGNPLVPDVAMYPFPSDFYLVADASTETGRRLALSDDAMPEGLSAAAFAHADGYSRAPIILAYMDGGIDASTLPTLTDPSAALEDDSSVWLLREDSWERVPLLVELDLNAAVSTQQALIIRPQVSLEPDAGYVVVLRDTLRAADGTSPLPVTDAFRALRDGVATDCDAVEAQRGDFELVNTAITATGLAPEEVVLAWSFHTRSEEQVLAPLVGIQDVATDWPLDGWSITSDEWDDDGQNRLIHGTFVAPDFLGPDEWVELDEDGAPVQHGTRDVEFMLTIPVTASEQTRPVVVYGHGFFSSLEEPTWSAENDATQRWQMAMATTNFIGTNEDDLFSAIALLADMDHIWVWVSQQIQSHAHFSLLGRLVSEELADVVTSDSGVPLFDPGAVHYMGVSNGGTQGFVILAASTVFTRGVLVVPGAFNPHMLERAEPWNTMGIAIRQMFPDPIDLQLALSIVQLEFDAIDSLSWMDHLTHDRLPGRPDVEVTLHMAVGDCQVSNMITEWLARTGQIPLVTPSPRDIWGLDTITADPPDGADTHAALFVYDELYPPLPEGNIPPAEDNDAHATIIELEPYLAQVGAFLEDGTIVQLCEGACDPE
jgi:hypothetical protein